MSFVNGGKKIMYITNKNKILITPEILTELGFTNRGKSVFKQYKKMNYWVKNKVCLFYNTPVSEFYQESYYIGYAELNQGKYYAVGIRWIDSVEELTKIYECLTNKSIESFVK